MFKNINKILLLVLLIHCITLSYGLRFVQDAIEASRKFGPITVARVTNPALNICYIQKKDGSFLKVPENTTITDQEDCIQFSCVSALENVMFKFARRCLPISIEDINSPNRSEYTIVSDKTKTWPKCCPYPLLKVAVEKGINVDERDKNILVDIGTADRPSQSRNL